jgi:Flp pilus assembly protein TadG
MARASRTTSQRGAELVEFALVLPLLLAVVAGIVDFGLMFQRQLVLTNAAREAARVRVLPGYTDTLAAARALAYVQAGLGGTPPGWNAPVIAQTCLPDCGTNPNIPVVTVTASMQQSYWLLGPIMNLFGNGSFNAGITLSASSTMRIEGP